MKSGADLLRESICKNNNKERMRFMIRKESGLTAVSVLVVLGTATNASFALAAEAAPVLNIVEVTNKGDVSLTFDKEMAEPAEGAEEQFKVTIDEAEVK